MFPWQLVIRIVAYITLYSIISASIDVPIFPSLTKIAEELPELFSVEIASDFGSTYLRWIVVFLLGVSIAVIIGVFASYYEKLAAVLVTDIDFWRSLPATALVSFFFAAFGDNAFTRVAPAFYITVFTTLFYVLRSSSQIDRRRQEHLKSLRASDRFVIFQWYFFEMLPFIVVAARQSVSLSFLVLISTELIVGSSGNVGVGNRLVDWFFYSDFEKILITLVFLGITGYGANVLAQKVANKVLSRRYEITA